MLNFTRQEDIATRL